MSKQHRDFVTYVRNGVAINALVAFSHDIYTPATQTEPAVTVEHLTLVYLDPAAASNSIPTGDQLRGSIKTEFSVPPLADGLVNGWKDVPYADEHIDALESIAGSLGILKDNPEDRARVLFEKQTQIDNLEKQVEELGASLKDADAAKTSVEAELVEAKARIVELTPKPIDVGVGQPAPTE